MKSAKALPRYGSGHKSAGQTDGRMDSWTDGQRQNNIPQPLAGDNNNMRITDLTETSTAELYVSARNDNSAWRLTSLLSVAEKYAVRFFFTFWAQKRLGPAAKN
ncbi:hypothetical protein DPMN_012786 [Dreissena polymorpha]|uniref:Uncharacterized protein n=1 Tax=Dreissena polymorpha TaxID=45954 RepID=A0A9D4N6H5_DREPO|nr:hypothetical protein DPMN_012786 [Dreissena polymorpha]